MAKEKRYNNHLRDGLGVEILKILLRLNDGWKGIGSVLPQFRHTHNLIAKVLVYIFLIFVWLPARIAGVAVFYHNLKVTYSSRLERKNVFGPCF